MSVGRFARLLGPPGLGLRLAGLCDEAERRYYARSGAGRCSTVVATLLLLVHMQPVGHLADAAAALLVLLTAAALSVFKPRGVTRYGRRGQREPIPQPH